jgi:hypothetical protein
VWEYPTALFTDNLLFLQLRLALSKSRAQLLCKASHCVCLDKPHFGCSFPSVPIVVKVRKKVGPRYCFGPDDTTELIRRRLEQHHQRRRLYLTQDRPIIDPIPYGIFGRRQDLSVDIQRRSRLEQQCARYSCESALNSMDWSAAKQRNTASRGLWVLGNQSAGYSKRHLGFVCTRGSRVYSRCMQSSLVNTAL